MFSSTKLSIVFKNIVALKGGLCKIGWGVSLRIRMFPRWIPRYFEKLSTRLLWKIGFFEAPTKIWAFLLQNSWSIIYKVNVCLIIFKYPPSTLQYCGFLINTIYTHGNVIYTKTIILWDMAWEKENGCAYCLIWLHQNSFINFYDDTIKISNDTVGHLWNTNIVRQSTWKCIWKLKL